MAGWIHSRQLEVIDYLRAENRVLRDQLAGRRLRFTGDQRRRLTVKGKIVGRRRLGEFAGLVTPDTILRWYPELIARKYDGSARRGAGRPATGDDVQRLVVRMATENPTWGYTRLVGTLDNLGHRVGRNTVRYLVLFEIDLQTRRVQLAGVVRQAYGTWMAQVARNLTDGVDGFLLGKRYLLHDRDPLFTDVSYS